MNIRISIERTKAREVTKGGRLKYKMSKGVAKVRDGFLSIREEPIKYKIKLQKYINTKWKKMARYIVFQKMELKNMPIEDFILSTLKQ